MIRVPGKDIDAINKISNKNRIAVSTTISFVYPLIFETGEKPIASNRFSESTARFIRLPSCAGAKQGPNGFRCRKFAVSAGETIRQRRRAATNYRARTLTVIERLASESQ